MTSHNLTLAAMLLLALTTASRCAQPVHSSPATAEANGVQQKIALVVGVERYQKAGLRNLQFAVADARKMHEELTKLGFVVDAVIGEEASLEGLQRAFVSFVAKSRKLNKTDIALVYMSGHGVQKMVKTTDVNGAIIQREEPFFCPNDAIKSDAKTLLSLNAVLHGLERSSGSETNIIFLDACRDSEDRGAKGIDGSNISSLSNKLVLFFAAESGHRSFESTQLEHGIFTYYLLEGIRGAAADSDKEITFHGLANYVSKRVERDSPELLSLPPNQAQRPSLMGNFSGAVILGRLPASESTATPKKFSNEEFAALYKEASELRAKYDDPTAVQPLLDRVAAASRGTSFPLAIEALALQNATSLSRDVAEEITALAASANSIDPDSAHTHLLNGIAARQEQKAAEAIRHFRMAIARNPYLVDAHLELVWVNTEDSGGDKVAGLKYAESSLAQFPNDYRVYNAYGTRLFNAERWDEGLKFLEKAIDLCPDNPLLWNNKGYGLYYGAKNLPKALAAYKKAGELAWEGSPWILTMAASICLEYDPPQLDDARRFAGRAVELEPTYCEPWIILANIKNHLNDSKGAIDTIAQALERVTTIKGKLELIAERVWLHLKQSELAKAEADIRLLTELSGNDIKIFAAPKSALLIRQGRKAEAGQLLDRVMGILRAEKADAAVIEEWQKLKNELMAYVR